MHIWQMANPIKHSSIIKAHSSAKKRKDSKKETLFNTHWSQTKKLKPNWSLSPQKLHKFKTALINSHKPKKCTKQPQNKYKKKWNNSGTLIWCGPKLTFSGLLYREESPKCFIKKSIKCSKKSKLLWKRL